MASKWMLYRSTGIHLSSNSFDSFGSKSFLEDSEDEGARSFVGGNHVAKIRDGL